jgi:hypothetical protein
MSSFLSIAPIESAAVVMPALKSETARSIPRSTSGSMDVETGSRSASRAAMARSPGRSQAMRYPRCASRAGSHGNA